MKFTKRGYARAVNSFPPKSDVAEVLSFIKAQVPKVAGTLEIVLPGNGGISAIVFREKEQPVTIENSSLTDEP